MKGDEKLLNKLRNMYSGDIRKFVREKSEYGTYIFNFTKHEDKHYYRDMLNKYRLITGGSLDSTEEEGVFFYCVNSLLKKNGNGTLTSWKVYTANPDFVTSGRFEEMYYQDEVCPVIRDRKEFDIWLKNFLQKIFGPDTSKMYSPKKFIYESMKNVKRYDDFLNEKKIPKLTIDIKELLSVLDDSKTDIFRTFKINKDEVGVRDDIDQLYPNKRFNSNVKKSDLKKGKAQNTQFSETLLDDKYVLKFFFVYDKGSIELEEPKFIILQYYNTETKEKSDILGFTNSDNINSFYEKLTDATIELSKGDDTYVYQTSNGGNNWEMKNVQMEDDEMKGTFDKKELQDMINKKKLNVSND